MANSRILNEAFRQMYERALNIEGATRSALNYFLNLKGKHLCQVFF